MLCLCLVLKPTNTYAAENIELALKKMLPTVNGDFSICCLCCQSGCSLIRVLWDQCDYQTKLVAFGNDQHNSSSTITWSSYTAHQLSV